MSRWFFALIFLLVFSSSVFAEGITGWTSLSYDTLKFYEDGDMVLKGKLFDRNFNLNLNKSITPAISYQFYLRGNYQDASQDSEGTLIKRYGRTFEPSFDIFLKNPIYDISAGYRRLEQWRTAHLVNESRQTSESYYTRLNIMPYDLPTLSLQYDKRNDFDHLSGDEKKLDNENTRYSAKSSFRQVYKNLSFNYDIDFSRNVNKSPIGAISESTGDVFNALYNIGYTAPLREGVVLSASYYGNYIRNKNVYFAKELGEFPFEKRLPFRGLYAKGTDSTNRNVNTLTDKPSLIDNDINTPTDINISNTDANKFHNIGTQISGIDKPVNRIRIYVNKDVTGDTKLSQPSNWEVYYSTNNLLWNKETGTISVNIVEDTVNNRHYYEITIPQKRLISFYKVINLETSSISDVYVTEIELTGPGVITQIGKNKDVSDAFNQTLNASADLKITDRLSLNVLYSVNRTDENPVAIMDSIEGIFRSLYSQTLKRDEGVLTNTSRTYGAALNWLTHRLLTTNLRAFRAEAFDNQDKSDFSVNSYSIHFGSTPIPAIDTGLLLMKTDNFSFGEKLTTNYSALLHFGARVYKDFIRMGNDFGYGRSKDHINETKSSSKNIRGTFDFLFTKDLTASMTYNIDWAKSEDSSSKTRGTSANITYRPGRFINLTGTFSISQDNEKNESISEGLFISWLPLPVIRISLQYTHKETDPGSKMDDTFDTNIGWYITKFLNLQLTYNFLKADATDKTSEGHKFGFRLNANFW